MDFLENETKLYLWIDIESMIGVFLSVGCCVSAPPDCGWNMREPWSCLR